MLHIKNLSKHYYLKDKEIVALKDLSLDVSKGEVICLLGPNGAGKTTTIKLIGTFVKPTCGDILYNNISINKRSEYLKHISVLFEGNRSIVWYLKVRENLEYFCGIRGFGLSESKRFIDRYIELFGLDKYENLTANQLSRGNQQKLALASVLCLNTDVVLLDEPTLGLDFEASDLLMKVIKNEASENGKIFIITSHDADFIDRVADRLVIIKNGEVKRIVKPDDFQKEIGESNLKDAYMKFIRGNDG